MGLYGGVLIALDCDVRVSSISPDFHFRITAKRPEDFRQALYH
ncbi:MAG: hypothetical protein Q8R39_00880 [bacterium]|nr:hypothetical protein [bacterium]MDZ4285064.1 hypothetical protein [Patescibacteria group bacterium]